MCPNGRHIVKGVTHTTKFLLAFTSGSQPMGKHPIEMLVRSRPHSRPTSCVHPVESTGRAAPHRSMVTIDDDGGRGGASGDAPAVDFAQYRARRHRLRLLDLLDTLIVAMERRDEQAVWDLLDEEDVVRSFPSGVRQEALMMSRLPRGSLRAPIRTYEFYHQLQQLADEPMAQVADPRQLSLDFPSAERGAIPFPNRPTAPPDDPRRGGGTDRRKSGSR
jgi:hypothetical protein